MTIHVLQSGGPSLRLVNPQTFDLDESIDPIALGAHSGMLWAGDQIRLAGLGEALRLPVDRPGGAEAAQAALRETFGDLFERGSVSVPEDHRSPLRGQALSHSLTDAPRCTGDQNFLVAEVSHG